MAKTIKEPNWFDKANDVIDNTEGSVINLLTAVAPWGAPTPPAYMSYIHALNVLEFPWWVAIIIAIVVEVLGLATVSTMISFWKYNQKFRNSSQYRKAPVWIVAGAFVFYLALIITSNVILDATGYFWPNDPNVRNAAIVVVKAFYTLLTVPAGLIIAVRQQHRNLLDEISQPRQVAVPEVPKFQGTGTGIPRNSQNRDKVFAHMDAVYAAESRVVSFKEIRDTLHIPQGSASRIRNEWIKERNLNSQPTEGENA